MENAAEGTQILTFQKVYEHLEGQKIPDILFGDSANIEGQSFPSGEALQLKVLLPDNLSFDMAVNIFTFAPGGHLPFAETHIMEHGLMFLEGQGIYRLGKIGTRLKKAILSGWPPTASNGLQPWANSLPFTFTIKT